MPQWISALDFLSSSHQATKASEFTSKDIDFKIMAEKWKGRQHWIVDVEISKQNHLWNDSGLAVILSKGIVFVVHDTQRIVRNIKGQSTSMFLEIMFLAWFDVVPHDFNVFVSVLTTLDMVQTKGMDKFMLNSAISREVKLHGWKCSWNWTITYLNDIRWQDSSSWAPQFNIPT